MPEPARPVPDPDHARPPAGEGLARRASAPPSLPPTVGGRSAAPLKYVEAPGSKGRGGGSGGKDAAVIRGIKDLQQLQQQTVAVLEAVKLALDDIGTVLRSPEATRGMEKQRNAATLLAKGFARDAIEQAHGAVELLPANPEAQLLLALSLAADQQFDAALGATRKGLALFDRRQHPLAIEAGLLHALAALGAGAEAGERWAGIIEALPLEVLLDHLPRIVACYPTDAPASQLDEVLVRRLSRRDTLMGGDSSRAGSLGQLPAAALLAGLDAAFEAGHLPAAHRAILAQVAGRLKAVGEPGDVVRFFGECLVPLGARRGREDAVAALARSGVKRLLRLHADAMVLHRAMTKLDMAGADKSAGDLARLLNHWRRDATAARSVQNRLGLAVGLLAAGAACLAWIVWGLGAAAGKPVLVSLFGLSLNLLWVGPALMAAGLILAVLALMTRTREVQLPAGRRPLTAEELRHLRTPAVKRSLKGILLR